MQVFTQRDAIKQEIKLCHKFYPNAPDDGIVVVPTSNKGVVMGVFRDSLSKIDAETMTAEEIRKLPGFDRFRALNCSHCGTEPEKVIEIPDSVDNNITLCRNCLLMYADLLK